VWESIFWVTTKYCPKQNLFAVFWVRNIINNFLFF
jgi:hypothetical protein